MSFLVYFVPIVIKYATGAMKYHVHKEIWEVAVGEMLVCIVREPQNDKDRYAVAVKK